MPSRTDNKYVGYSITIPTPKEYDTLTLKEIRRMIADQGDVVVRVTVTKIVDGDTYHCYHDESDKLKVRVFGIDMPEKKNNQWDGMPLADEATDALASMIENKVVVLRIVDIDRYGRVLGLTYFCEDGLWRNVSCEMLILGMASVYRDEKKKPCDIDGVMDELESNAKVERVGVWGLDNYEEPKAYRRRMRMGREHRKRMID